MKSSTSCLSLLLAIAAWPSPGLEPVGDAHAAAPLDGLQHCVDADGVTIFTDQRCSDLQATQQAEPPRRPEPPGILVRVRSCARNQDDFLQGVRGALESRDVNRLADYYHWTGMDTASGYRLMERLAAFSGRQLVDVQLVSRLEPEIGGWNGPSPDREVIDPFQATDDDPLADTPATAPAPAHPAELLRVDQMGSEEDLGVQATYFRLRNNAGCWWMQF
jgi:hypothetical protein